jgi:hypothetical protein
MKNEPAFPVPSELCQGLTVEQRRGMTLRDYFAAKALDALILASSTNENMVALLLERAKTNNFDTPTEDWLAYSAYAQADAMLKVREKCTS